MSEGRAGETFDVAVAGTGPAACMAALTLARQHVDVVMIEAATPPRYKACGGGLTRRAANQLLGVITPRWERECHTVEVVAEARDGHEAVSLVQKHHPNLVLMDLSMPRMNGLEALIEIRKRFPETKVLILTVHDTDEHIMAVLQAGAAGYVLKDAGHVELLGAIHAALEGKPFLSPGVSQKVIGGYLEGVKTRSTVTAWDSLTQREREVLKLIAEGQRNKVIADFLNISVKTVEKHRASVMEKLAVNDLPGLVRVAIKHNLIFLDD